jgi:hypothetical protein
VHGGNHGACVMVRLLSFKVLALASFVVPVLGCALLLVCGVKMHIYTPPSITSVSDVIPTGTLRSYS